MLPQEERDMLNSASPHKSEAERASYLSPMARDRIVHELGHRWIAASELAAELSGRGVVGLSENEIVELCNLLPGSQNPFFGDEAASALYQGNSPELDREYRRAKRFVRKLAKALDIWKEEGIDPFFPFGARTQGHI